MLKKLIGLAFGGQATAMSLPIIVGLSLAALTIISSLGVYGVHEWRAYESRLKGDGAKACVSSVNEESLKVSQQEVERLKLQLEGEQSRSQQLSNAFERIREESKLMHLKIADEMKKQTREGKPATIPNTVIDIINSEIKRAK